MLTAFEITSNNALPYTKQGFSYYYARKLPKLLGTRWRAYRRVRVGFESLPKPHSSIPFPFHSNLLKNSWLEGDLLHAKSFSFTFYVFDDPFAILLFIEITARVLVFLLVFEHMIKNAGDIAGDILRTFPKSGQLWSQVRAHHNEDDVFGQALSFLKREKCFFQGISPCFGTDSILRDNG